MTARVAQLVERQAFNLNVQGSSPCSGEDIFFIINSLIDFNLTWKKIANIFLSYVCSSFNDSLENMGITYAPMSTYIELLTYKWLCIPSLYVPTYLKNSSYFLEH